MIYRLGFALLWICFSVYAFFLAPPDDPGTLELIQHMASGEIAGINPLIVAEFNLMGLLPLVYTCLLLVDGARQRQLGQKIPAWPFGLMMMGVGAFALLPYLILRRPLEGSEPLPEQQNWILRLCQSRWLAWLLTSAILGLLIYGISQGNWIDFLQQWQSSRFIHVMTLDFLLLISLLPFFVAADQVGRQSPPAGLHWIPLLGPLVYLCLRPQQSEISGLVEEASIPAPDITANT